MSHTHTHTPSFLTPFPLTVNQTIQEEDIMNIVKMHQFYIFYFPRLERTEIKFYTFFAMCPFMPMYNDISEACKLENIHKNVFAFTTVNLL